MKKTFFYTTLLASVLILNACSTAPVCITSSVTPMQGKVITENLGKAEGADTAYSVLGLYMIGRPDLDIALKDAIAKKGGDTLINVSCYETYSWFLLFSMTTVKVEGEAVKFSVIDNDSRDNRKVKMRDKK